MFIVSDFIISEMYLPWKYGISLHMTAPNMKFLKTCPTSVKGIQKTPNRRSDNAWNKSEIENIIKWNNRREIDLHPMNLILYFLHKHYMETKYTYTNIELSANSNLLYSIDFIFLNEFTMLFRFDVIYFVRWNHAIFHHLITFENTIPFC